MVDAAQNEIQALLDDGLRLYEAGQPARALELWYRVLDLEPRHPVALEYVQYVRDNFHVDVREPRLEIPVASAPLPDAPVFVEPARAVLRDDVGSEANGSPANGVEAASEPEPELAPVEETAPVEDVPAVELMPAPSFTRPPAVESSPVVEETPPVESSPVEESSPIEESSPVVEETSPVESSPVEETAAVESSPVVEETASVESSPVLEEAPSASTASLGAGWGDLIGGDLDLDPLTGQAVQRASGLSSVGSAYVDVSGVEEGIEIAPASLVEPKPVEAPPELPALAMTPLPVEEPAPAAADAAPSPLALAATPVPAEEEESPWDGHSGITEAVDLDTEADQPSAMELLLASPARRPHVDGSLRGPSEGGPGARASSAKPSEPQSELESLMEGARDLFELGDFSGSLELVEKVLRQDPENAEAHAYLARNESTLLKMYESKLGQLTARPRVLTSPDEVIWMNLHHRAGFVLSQVDGELSYEDIAAISGMSRFETFRILAELVQNGVIA